MNTEKKIYNCLGVLLDCHISMKDWDDEGFIENKDLCLSKSLLKRQSDSWTSKMAYSAWKIINKYKNYIDSDQIDFESLEKPDYCDSDLSVSFDFNTVEIEKNKFIINKPCPDIKKTFNANDDVIKKQFNLENLFKLLPFILENKISINKEYFKFINMFLNIIPSEDMYNGFNIDKKIFKFDLKPFQAIGCLYMLINKRIILGDEMGLGKTLQALTSIFLSDKKPCLIICPNMLTFNWENEIHKNFKNQKVEFLKKNSKKGSDFYIINYESIHNYIDLIKDLEIKSVILDESHYIKNKDAKRTVSSLKAIKNIEYRFALTGTAILKSPVELISQLKAINQLDCFGNENTFAEKFCGNANTQWGKDLRKGASNLDILNRELREYCFIRREKNLLANELPEKNRSYIFLKSKSKKYSELHNEFLGLNKNDKLKKLEPLRQLAAKDKIKNSIEWIDNFLETEKKLVVFAYHKEIQEKLINHYPTSAKIISNMTDIDRKNNIDKFMNDEDCKLIICSLKSASVGLTLTAASDVLFVEMDWCAANNNQAEDRCHRIGQTNNVNIWYLISKDTIEEHIYKIVEKKRVLIDKIYSSKIPEEYDILKSSIIDNVIDELTALETI